MEIWEMICGYSSFIDLHSWILVHPSFARFCSGLIKRKGGFRQVDIDILTSKTNGVWYVTKPCTINLMEDISLGSIVIRVNEPITINGKKSSDDFTIIASTGTAGQPGIICYYGPAALGINNVCVRPRCNTYSYYIRNHEYESSV